MINKTAENQYIDIAKQEETTKTTVAAHRVLTQRQAREIRRLRKAGIGLKEIAGEYLVKEDIISGIENNELYKEDKEVAKKATAILFELQSDGYYKEGMLNAIKTHMFNEYSWAIGEPDDEDEGDEFTTEWDMQELVDDTFAAFDLVPDAWRIITKRDDLNRLWTIFEAVEIESSPMTKQRLKEYTELWFLLDSLDELVDIKLVRIDLESNRTEQPMQDLFYELS